MKLVVEGGNAVGLNLSGEVRNAAELRGDS